MKDKVLVYGLYVDQDDVDQDDVDLHIKAVKKVLKYAWDREYPVDRAMHLVYLVNGHHVKWKEVQDIYKEFKDG